MPYKTPKGIVEAVAKAGCAKANLPVAKQLVLGFLAGAFIAFGGVLAIVVGKGSPALAAANPGLSKFVFAAVFPVGIMMVLIAGSELFTGNCGIILPACLTGAAKWKALLKNWLLVYIGNLIGSLFVVFFFAYWTDIINVNVGGLAADLGKASAAIAEAKVNKSFWVLLLRGVGCNWLVNLALWLAIASDDIMGKIAGLWFPIMAFVAMGLEHSIANMFFIPLGMLNGANVTVGQFLFVNLLPVTLGNIIGGAGLVGAVYWWLYAKE